MKSYKTCIIGLLSILTLISCEDFLSVDIKGIYTEKNFFKNEEAVVDAVTGLYGILVVEDFVAHGDYTWDVCSDDMFRAGDHSEDEALETFTLDAGNNMLKAGWKWKYEMISRANNLLMNVPSMTNITDAIRKRSIGEAYFFRAFAYWWLYLPYGEVPLILEEDVRNTNYNKPKATVEELLSLIEHDLLLAVENLDETASAGRITKGTAYAYLTQLYMHWASYEGKESKLDDAIASGSKIVNTVCINWQMIIKVILDRQRLLLLKCYCMWLLPVLGGIHLLFIISRLEIWEDGISFIHCLAFIKRLTMIREEL